MVRLTGRRRRDDDRPRRGRSRFERPRSGPPVGWAWRARCGRAAGREKRRRTPLKKGPDTFSFPFTVTGGTINLDVNTQTDDQGKLNVNGGVNLSTAGLFVTEDLANPPFHTSNKPWILFTWTGAGNGTLSVFAPANWTINWNAQNLTLTEPQ